MGHSYFTSQQQMERVARREAREENSLLDSKRRELAAKIVMALVDKVVNEIVRPGPKPEERECYVMAGELRAIVPDLEQLAKQIIDVNDGVE